MLFVPFVFSMPRFQGPSFRCNRIVVIVTLLEVNCKERTTCTNSSEGKSDLCEDQDQQCSVKYKSKWKADRTANVNFNALKFTSAVWSAFHLDFNFTWGNRRHSRQYKDYNFWRNENFHNLYERLLLERKPKSGYLERRIYERPLHLRVSLLSRMKANILQNYLYINLL